MRSPACSQSSQGRVTDLAARIGGEEFGIVLPSTPVEGGCHLAESIRAAVEAMVLKHTITRPCFPSPSALGVSCFSPSPGDSIVAFVESADKALYEAKHAGRNRVCIAPAMAHTLLPSSSTSAPSPPDARSGGQLAFAS